MIGNDENKQELNKTSENDLKEELKEELIDNKDSNKNEKKYKFISSQQG